jgi:hypothetical protein
MMNQFREKIGINKIGSFCRFFSMFWKFSFFCYWLVSLIFMLLSSSGRSFHFVLNSSTKKFINFHSFNPKRYETTLSAVERISITTKHTDEDLLRLLKNKDPDNNISDSILSKVGRNLHLQKNHPLNIIKTK